MRVRPHCIEDIGGAPQKQPKNPSLPMSLVIHWDEKQSPKLEIVYDSIANVGREDEDLGEVLGRE